jgi:hypothetical protein
MPRAERRRRRLAVPVLALLAVLPAPAEAYDPPPCGGVSEVRDRPGLAREHAFSCVQATAAELAKATPRAT